MTIKYAFSNQRKVLQYLGTILVLFVINGCVALQPFPNTGRSGDTITLAVGSADGMTDTNTTVIFYSDADINRLNPISVPVRSVLKIYPDKTSAAWLNDSAPIPRRSSHGPWLSLLVLDLPSLPEGTGVFNVSSTGEVEYPVTAANMIGVDIPFTILPGSGSPHPLNYATLSNPDGTGALGDTDGNLITLGPMPQAIIKPTVPPEGTATTYSYGAIEMNLTIPITLVNSGGSVPAPDDEIVVTLDDQPQNTLNQTQLIWTRTGNNMKIMLISPKGMYSHEARVSIIPLGYSNGINVYGINGTPTLDSINYYDLNGAPSSNPLPPLPTITIIDNPLFPS